MYCWFPFRRHRRAGRAAREPRLEDEHVVARDQGGVDGVAAATEVVARVAASVVAAVVVLGITRFAWRLWTLRDRA